MAIFLLLFLFSSGIYWTGITLVVLGMFSRGTSPVIKTMIAESINDRSDYDKGYSLYSFSSKLASIISRPLFGFLGSAIGISSVFYTSAIIALLTTIPANSRGKS